MADDIHSHKWRLDKGGAYYSPATQSELQGGNQVRYFDFATGESRLVVEVEGTVSPGMAVSPDGRSLLFSVGPPAGRDLMLVEGFE